MNNTLKVVSSITIISLIAKVFGAGRELSLSYCFGSSSLSDAYILATTIPVTIFNFIYESISAGFIPACSKLSSQGDQLLFTNKVINFVLIVSLVVVILIECFPKFVVCLFASGFDVETVDISSSILKICIIGVFFTGISNIIVAYLNLNNSFLIASARAIPLDIIVILSIFIGYYLDNIIILALGVPLSIAVSTLFLIPEAKRFGFHYLPSFDFKDEKFVKLISLSLPIIISTALMDINSIVDRQFASYLCVGGISIITYSSRLISIFTSLLVAPVITFMFPNITKVINEGRNAQANDIYVTVLKHLILIIVPIVLFIIGMSSEIVEIVFKRGAFGEKETLLTSDCLLFYSLLLVAFAVSSLATKFFYADSDMWTPLKISLAGVIINIIGNVLLSRLLGLKGLALASSLSLLIVSTIQHFVLVKKRIIITKDLFHFILVIIIASLMGSIIFFAKDVLLRICGLFVGTVLLLILYLCIFTLCLKVFKIHKLISILKY